MQRAAPPAGGDHVPAPRGLRLLVFVVGSASLGTEIAAARLLAPYFGASTIVWANTIAVVLLALSAGYAIGGRLADRSPTDATLGRLVVAAAALLAAVPFVATPFLDAASRALDTISAEAFVGSLAGVLILCAVPLLLLGAVTPFALRLSLRGVEDSGRVSGRLSAISTLGALTGTFLSALVLIPWLGTRDTFLAFALGLAVVGIRGAPRWGLGVAALLIVLLALPPRQVRATADGRVIYEADTTYQHLRVIQRPDGERWLELNEGQAIHSLLRPGSFLTGNYWDDPLVLPLATRGAPPRRLAILGDAAGTTARAYGRFFPQTAVDAVEIDGALTAVGRRLFDLHGPRLRTIAADARPFLRGPGPRYDAIEVDAYRQPYIPFYLTTREFFAEAAARLTRPGLVMVNVGHPSTSGELERVIAATLRAVFPYVAHDVVDETNVFVVASRRPLDPGLIRTAAPALDPAVRPLAATVAARLGPAPAGGAVYTDDRAPVEWLVDSSLFGYATKR
ncbi:MAG: spermidine synthase [Solirubrobacteraceae bacterium]